MTQRVTQLINSIENFAEAPSASQVEQVNILKPLLQQALADVRARREDVDNLNKMMREANLPYISAPTGGGPPRP